MHHVTATDKTRLYVKDWGSGRPVILIHGWPLSADSWDDQAMAIANAGHRAIAYDRRGFGRSSQPWAGYDYDTLADDLAAVIEQTAAQDAVLVGFSMGGGEVARYMSRHGGKSVAQAVLISSVLPFRLKAADNPAGTEQAAFDKTALALNEACRVRSAHAHHPWHRGQDGADRRVEPGRVEGHRAQHTGRVRRCAARCVRDPQASAHPGPARVSRALSWNVVNGRLRGAGNHAD
jgi:pimeloyl-ACP methyl ester carboxylesterase